MFLLYMRILLLLMLTFECHTFVSTFKFPIHISNGVNSKEFIQQKENWDCDKFYKILLKRWFMASGNLLGTTTRVKNYKKIGTAYWSLLKLNFSIRKSTLLCGILRRREKRENCLGKLEKFDRYSSTVCRVSVDAEARDN